MGDDRKFSMRGKIGIIIWGRLNKLLLSHSRSNLYATDVHSLFTIQTIFCRKTFLMRFEKVGRWKKAFGDFWFARSSRNETPKKTLLPPTLILISQLPSERLSSPRAFITTGRDKENKNSSKLLLWFMRFVGVFLFVVWVFEQLAV